MRKLDLKLGSIKELLSNEQMKKVIGGYISAHCSCSDGRGEWEDCDTLAQCNDQCKTFCTGVQ